MVVVIIGILATMFTLSVGVVGSDRELEREADRLAALLRLASEDASLQGREIGLQFYQHGYEFSAQDPDTGAWVLLSDDEQLRARELPPELLLDLEIEGRQVNLAAERPPDDAEAEVDPGDPSAYQPQIYVFSSGEVTPPFTLRLRRRFGDLVLAVATGDEQLVEVRRESL